MSNSMVRLALEGSVASTSPPVRFHSSQVSTVPDAQLRPDRHAAAALPAGVSSHSIFVPLKYGSSTSPVRWRTSGRWPAAASASQRAAVRRSCQTMARW